MIVMFLFIVFVGFMLLACVLSAMVTRWSVGNLVEATSTAGYTPAITHGRQATSPKVKRGAPAKAIAREEEREVHLGDEGERGKDMIFLAMPDPDDF